VIWRLAISIALAVVVSACAGAGAATSPASLASNNPASALPTPTAPTPPTAAPEATPVAAGFDGVPATTLSLGADTAPIDVTFAFGSIWTADHHKNRVTRLDPATMAVQARVPVGTGPGWFVVTDDALWVSSQLGRGLNRIDPVANTSDVQAGMWPTCGRGTFAFGSIWQPACDAHQLMRIDPAANTSTDISWGNPVSIVLADGKLIAGGPDGLALVDPEKGGLTPIGGTRGWIIGSDGTAIWLSDEEHVIRANPASGKMLGSLDVQGEVNFLLRNGHVLLATSTDITEIEPKTMRVVRSIKLGFQPVGLLDAAGYLWVTNFDGSSIIRLELPA
jgi:streptogramin lyase